MDNQNSRNHLYKDKERENVCIGVIGALKTGKSTTIRQLITTYKKANPENIIVGFDPQKMFQDLIDINIDPDLEDWPVYVGKLKNALVILDDIRLIHEQDKALKGVNSFLINLGENNVDVIHVCHNPKQLLNSFAYHTTMYLIFYTNVQEGSFKDKVPNYTLGRAASIRVNNYVKHFGRGSYPKFPYIRVNIEKQILEAVNMNRQLSRINLHKK